MPCGHLDARLQGHRCAHCQKGHRKCDGARPCAPCRQRNISCENSKPSKRNFSMVQYQRQVPSRPLAQALSIDTWHFVTIFFDAISRSDGLLMSAYSFEKIGQLVQHHGLVFDAVATVGATYARQRHSRPHIGIGKLRHQIASTFNETRALEDSTFLLRASLLGFAELMVDQTGMRWNAIVQRLQTYYLPLCQYLSSVWKTLDPSLLRLVRASIIFRILMFSSGPQTMSMPDSLMRSGPQSNSLSGMENKLECLIRMLEVWARLKTRFLRWIDATCDPTSREIEGLAIVSIGCELQREIIYTLLGSSAPDDFVQPMCRWVLAGTCHMFSHSVWNNYEWEVPVMQSVPLQDQALVAIEGVERIIEKSPMESVFYGSISPIMSLQITLGEERERVIKLLQNIQKKGFKVASAFEADVRLVWAGSSSESIFYS